MKSIVQNRSLVVLAIAESVSSIGNWITMMALFSLIVFQGNGDVAQSSGIFLAGLGPLLLFSPFAGWLCDRFDRKKLMITSDLLSALVVACLIFTTRIEWMYALLAIQAMCGSLIMPARQSSVATLVAREHLTQANAFLQQIAAVTKIAAPMLAGLLLTLLEPRQAMLLDVISFVLSAIILSRLPALLPQARETKLGTSTERASTTRIPPRLLLLFGIAFLLTLNIMGFDVLSSVYVRDVLQGAEGLYGLLIGLVGLGAVVGAASLMARKKQVSPWRDVVLALLLLACIPLTMALAALVDQPWLAQVVVGVGCFIGGIGNGLLLVQTGTLLQLLSPAESLGRMGGMFQTSAVAGQLLAILLVPLLVPALLPLATYFMLTVALLLLVAVGTVVVLFQTRQGLTVRGYGLESL